MKDMSEKRGFSFLLVNTLLTVALGGWILTAAMQRTIGEPAAAKTILHESGFYQAVVPSQLADAQQANPGLANIPLGNPMVQKVLGSSLDAKKLEAEGDKAVDGVYSWLEGKSTQPTIAISVLPDQQALTTALSEYAAKHAATLPVCGPADDTSNFATDPISATCLPAGVTPDTVKTYVAQAVSGNPALAVSTELNQDDVKLPNGKTIIDNFKQAPVWYQRAQLLPLIFAAAAVLFMILLLMILKPVGAARAIGKNMLSVGITLAVCAALLAWGTEKLYSTFIPKSDNPNIGDAIMQLTNAFNTALRDNIIYFGVGTAAVGLVLFVIAWVLGKVHRPAKTAVSKPSFASLKPASLASSPLVASFTPARPTPSAPPLPAKKPAKKRAAKAKTPAKKKPAARKKKK